MATLDPERRALVIGCGSYEDTRLKALEATATDLTALEEVLRDPEIGRFTNLKVIHDGQKHVVEREIQKFLREAPYDSVVLLYLTGHGIKDVHGTLYFAQQDTDNDLLESSAISANFIKNQMESCRSSRKVLLLDCCFAGAFPKGTVAKSAAADVSQELKAELSTGRGFVAITAAGEFQYAYTTGSSIEVIEGKKPQPSVFTKHLVEGLRSGEADYDNDGLVKVYDIFNYVKSGVAADRPEQTPKLLAEVEEDFVIATAKQTPGEDVVETLRIDPAEAIIGKNVTHTLENGEKVKLEISPNTKSGEKIVLAGQGGRGKHGGKPGDLIIQVEIAAKAPIMGENLFAEVTISGEDADEGTIATIEYDLGSLDVDIPANTEDGKLMKVAGKGLPGSYGGPPGDLWVTVNVAAGKPIRGQDYHAEVQISADESDAGCTKIIDTPAAQGFKIDIPAGTKDGFVFPPKRGLGSPGRRGGMNGDLIVTVKVLQGKAADYFAEVLLTPDEASKGALKVLEGQFGRLELVIPENTRAGEKRMKGRGAPGMNGRLPGDLILAYKIQEAPKVEAPKEEEKKEEKVVPPPPKKFPVAAKVAIAVAVILIGYAITRGPRHTDDTSTTAGTSQSTPAGPSLDAGQKALTAGDYATAKDNFSALSLDGNAEAMYQLGHMALDGEGGPKDPAGALGWMSKAADKGHVLATSYLGYMYQSGIGTTVNYAEALKWNQKAADLGDATAMDNLGNQYANGNGVDKNPYTAFSWYEKSANAGSGAGANRLADCYASGNGTTKDDAAALKYYTMAADRGNAAAMTELGLRAERGTPPDAATAFTWYQKAADGGDAFGMACLGNLYVQGKGTQMNKDLAFTWFKKAAEGGNTFGMFCLGLCFEKGTGVGANLSEAKSWYKKAADLGDLASKDALARLNAIATPSITDSIFKVQATTLGADYHTITDSDRKAFGLPSSTSGVVVQRVEFFGSAYQAGLRAGDVIDYFDNHILINSDTLKNLLQKSKAGQTYKISYERYIAGKLKYFNTSVTLH